MLLDFLVIGAQKAGTSSLYVYLQQQDEIEMSKKKELHFFDDDKINWTQPCYEIYHKEFSATSTQKKGEITPFYMYDERCMNRIAKYNPNIKLIILLRNPIERAFSQYKMSVHVNKKETQDFSWCIREGRNRIRNNELSNHIYSYVERGFYGKQISYIYSRFPKNQVLVLKTTDLELDPIKTITTICQFLNINFTSLKQQQIHENISLAPQSKMKQEDYDLLIKIYKHDDLLLKNLCGVSFFH